MTVSADVRAMVAAGYGRDDVIARFGCRPAVLVAYKRAIEKPHVRTWGTPGIARDDVQRTSIRGDMVLGRWHHEQAVAGILHLVDLKRAGHSPTRTEHRIPPDREQGAPITRPLLPISFVGSQLG